MDSYIQVLSFVLSFAYGIVFYLLAKFNYFILDNKNAFIKFLVTFVFIIDVVVIYVYLMYRLNNGNFHIYFVGLVIIGFLFIANFYEKLKKLCKKCVNKLKYK